MKFGINIPPFTNAATVLEWTRAAEASGWDGVFLWDHVQLSPGTAPLDPWTLLGAMAQVTERVTLGTLVTPLSRRRPHIMAKQLTTVDHLSNGRAVLGVGLGDPVDRDFDAFGEETSARVRAARLDEALTVIDGLLQGPTDFTGEHFSARADFHPLPVQRPRPPIWVAGGLRKPRPLARARGWDGVVPVSTRSTLRPDEIAAHLASDGEAARPGWDVVVIPEARIPAEEYADAGVTWLVPTAAPTDDGWENTIDRLARGGPDATTPAWCTAR